VERGDHPVWRGKHGGDAKCDLPRAHVGQAQRARWRRACAGSDQQLRVGLIRVAKNQEQRHDVY